MGALEYVLGALLILISLAIVAIVLFQQGRQAGLSGAIAGGAESFLGKTKSRKVEAKLERVTKYLAVVFFVLVLTAFLLLLFL